MEAQNGEESTPEDMNLMVPAELYLRKYLALQRRCEQVQQTNERLINRLQHVKRTIRKFRKERKFLMNRLDGHEDNYQDAVVPYPWEETTLLGPGPPPALPELLTVKTETEDEPSFASPSESSCAATPAVSKGKKIKGDGASESSPGQASAAPLGKRDTLILPKKPANAFLMFCQQQRSVLQEEYRKERGEEITHQDLTRQLALLWNGLPADKKQVYYELYEKDKVRYETEMKQLSVRDTTTPQDGTIIDVVGSHQSNSLMDAQLLKLDIKQEPI